MDLGEFNKFLAGFPIESEQQPPVAATENTIPDLDAQILALQKQKEDREKRQREMEERKAIQTIQIHSPGVTGEPIHNVLTEIKDVLVDLRQHLGTLMEREIHNTSYVYRTVKELKDIVKDHSLGVYLDIKPGVAPKGKNVTSRNMVTTGELTLSREAGGAVILPTLWLYIHTRFDAETYFLGLMLSAFSFAAIVTGPVFGRWTDRSRHPRLIILLGIMFEVAGNIMYFMGISKWFLLGSRLVCGVGGGAEAVVMAEVTRTTAEDKRTGIISILIAVRQCGLLIGPGLNLFLREIDFQVASFHIDKYNDPGAFMACIWVVQFLLVVFCYTDLHKLQKMTEDSEKLVKSNVIDSAVNSVTDQSQRVPRSCDSHNINQSEHRYDSYNINQSESLSNINSNAVISDQSKASCDKDELTNHTCDKSSTMNSAKLNKKLCNSPTPDELMETAENFIGKTGHNVQVQDDVMENGSLTDSLDKYDISTDQADGASREYLENSTEKLEDYLHGRSKWKFLYEEYIREEIITIIAIQFNSFFNQIGLETMVTPIAENLLGWGELENSIFYCIGGAEIIIVFIVVRKVSQKLQDRTMIAFGNVTLVVAVGFLLYFVPNSPPDSPRVNLPKFIVGVFLDLLALPFLVAATISLYSKLTRKETQGLSMGIRKSAVGLATILGPLWAGGALNWPYIMFGVMEGLLVMSLVMLLCSFGKLKSTVKENVPAKHSSTKTSDSNEKTPLLA